MLCVMFVQLLDAQELKLITYKMKSKSSICPYVVLGLLLFFRWCYCCVGWTAIFPVSPKNFLLDYLNGDTHAKRVASYAYKHIIHRGGHPSRHGCAKVA